jgi:hypothetical protein
MAKKAAKKRKTGIAPVSAQPMTQPEVINPLGETQVRKIVKSKIQPSEFTLSDGTKLILKPLIGDVRRAVGQYNAHGQPLYFLSIGNTLESKPPKSLMRKKPKVKTSSK